MTNNKKQEGETIRLNLVLSKQELDRFYELKEASGKKCDTDVIKWILRNMRL